MRLRLIETSLRLLLLIVLIGARTEAQESHALDWSLSQLRGSWEFRTFRDKWTLVFECDHKMLLDREPVDYSLIPGAIRVQDGSDSTDYPYTLSDQGLTLTLPDGSERTYRITEPGEAERLVHGTLYASANASSSRENISFDGDHLFVLQTLQPGTIDQSQSTGASVDHREALIEKKGVYRVEADVVVLAFDDSTSIEAKVHFRDEDGSITSVTIDDRLFTAEEPAAAPLSLPPVQLPMASAPPIRPDIVPIYVPEAPPAYSISTAPPAVPTAPAGSDKKSAKPAEKHRDFGTTRGKGDGK